MKTNLGQNTTNNFAPDKTLSSPTKNVNDNILLETKSKMGLTAATNKENPTRINPVIGKGDDKDIRVSINEDAEENKEDNYDNDGFDP